MGRNVALGADIEAPDIVHTLMTLDGGCSKVKGNWICCVAMLVKMVCSLGYLSAKNINVCVSVCACQNILLCLCSSCSLISVSRRQQCILYYFSTFPLLLCAHTGAPHPFVSISNLWTHTSLRHFHSSRPTVFLLDDTVAPANRLQRQDISDISRNLTFMGLVFSLSPILHGTHSAFSILASSRTPVRKSSRFWLSCCWIFKERKKKRETSILFGADQFSPQGELQEKHAFPIVLGLHIAWGGHLCLPPLSAPVALKNCQVTTKVGTQLEQVLSVFFVFCFFRERDVSASFDS